MMTQLDFEAVRLQFIEDYTRGLSPSWDDYARRYPQFADELLDFTLDWLPMQRAVERESATSASSSTLALIAQLCRETSAPAKTLTDAARQRGWSPGRLAREIGLPERLGVALVRGVSSWPAKLETRLSDALARPVEEVRAWLLNASPRPATAFRASEQPISSSPAKSKTWDDVLKECVSRGEMTEDEAREWM